MALGFIYVTRRVLCLDDGKCMYTCLIVRIGIDEWIEV